MKAHDWLNVARHTGPYLLRYALRDMIDLRAALDELFACMDILCRRSADCSDSLSQHENSVGRRFRACLRIVERLLPSTERAIIMHLFIHLPRQVWWQGPCWTTWMFPYERFVGWLKRFCRSRNQPEAAMMRMVRTTLFAERAHSSFFAGKLS